MCFFSGSSPPIHHPKSFNQGTIPIFYANALELLWRPKNLIWVYIIDTAIGQYTVLCNATTP